MQGQPVYWLSNVDPVARSAAAPPSVDLANPSLFMGQSMTDYVLVVPRRNGPFAGRPGRDFPEGVRLGSWSRLLAFAWLFGDKNLIFSGDLTNWKYLGGPDREITVVTREEGSGTRGAFQELRRAQAQRQLPIAIVGIGRRVHDKGNML